MEASPAAEPDGGSSRPSSKLRLSSTSIKHVDLYDWWLIRTETFSGHHNLGVGGLIYDPRLEPRIFRSAAILKRHGGNVLEAFDGITITVVGSINLMRTRQNGFSSEVCRHFLCGFPYYWEDYAGADGSISRAYSSPNSFVPESFHDLPIPLMRDFSFSPSCQVYGVCELQKSTMKNTERSCENDHDDAHLVPPKEGNGQVTSIDSQEHEISIKNRNIDEQHQIKDTVIVDTDKSRRRPSTRSNSRVITGGIQQEKNFLSSSIIKSPPLSKSVSISKIPMKRQHGESANEENMPNLNLKARKAATLRNHTTSSRLGTEGTQKEKDDAIPSATEKRQGSVGGKSVTTTRKLTLRSRSVDVYI